MIILNKTICCFLIFLFFTYSCKNENVQQDIKFIKKIVIDSLCLLKNFDDDNSLGLYNFESIYIKEILLSANLQNISNEIIVIKIIKNKYNLIYDVDEYIQIYKNKIYILKQRSEPIDIIYDTLFPDEKYKYYITYYGPLKKEKGHIIYLKYKIPIFHIKTDTLYLKDSTFAYLSNDLRIELEENNSFIIRIDLFKNTASLVDSTFEEVLESYKRRGYIVQ